MSEKITLEQLESYLWGSADFLRSSIDAGEYKQYIFPLLFFKRLCDVHDEEYKKAVKEYGENLGLFDEDAIYSFIIPDGAHWNDVRTTPTDVGMAIVKAFKAIEAANAEKGLEGVFGDGSWTNKQKLPDRLLKDLLEHFSKYTLSLENCPEDELGNGYEYLIKKFADDSGHSAQEFYTNRTVVHLMTELLEPQSGESVYDPTCGTAGMLISCIAYLKKHGREWRNLQVYGQEITTLTACISKINLILHGIQDFHIVNDDTLINPAFTDGNKLKTFDLCLANPPYSIKTWNRDAFASDKYGRNFLGTPPQGCADYAFLQHILKSLNSTRGRCAVLLPNGILSRYSETSIREKLVKADLVECIIGLGKGLFYNSPMESCILIARANKSAERKGKVLFIDARKSILPDGKNMIIPQEEIDRIAEIYDKYYEEKDFSIIVDNSIISENNYSMSLSLYLSRIISEAPDITFDEAYGDWASYSKAVSHQYEIINSLIGGGIHE